MDQDGRSRLDLLLDLLSDEVVKRLEQRSEIKHAPLAPAPPRPLAPITEPAPAPEPETQPTTKKPSTGVISEIAGEQSGSVESVVQSHAAPLMLRLAFGILLIVILINIPLNAQGIAIARSIPSSAALVIADGLVVKESNSTDVWVYRDNAFHWITSLDAFEYYGYRWQDVHVVEPGFLSEFPKGTPIYVLLKCDASPHIYRLEAGQKRWIVDIPTFLSEGYVWQDVKFVPCPYLRSLPSGDSIPPGRGTPPPPLP